MPDRPDSALDLLEMTPEEVDRFFATEDPERVVAQVDALDDKQLSRLVRDRPVRTSAIRHVLARLDEFALPGPLAEVKGVVEFLVEVPKADPERHQLRFDGATVAPVFGADLDADVTVRMGAVDFVRMVSGGTNAALLLLAGRLHVDGDEGLALKVGGVFQVPGQPGVAVDPAAVDPDAAADALRHVKDAHLEKVMASGFRELILEQIVTRLPDFLDHEKAGDRQLTVGFRIGGRPDGGADRVVVHVDRGTCRAERDAEGDRDATLLLSGGQFVKLVTGHLNPVTAVMRGSIKVRGDLQAALSLHRVMRIPGTR